MIAKHTLTVKKARPSKVRLFSHLYYNLGDESGAGDAWTIFTNIL